MERPDNPVFEITIDNIESVYNRVKANKYTDFHELMFIKSRSDVERAVESNADFIFLIDSVTLYYLKAKRGTAAYNSFVNDKRLKNIRISLHSDRNHKDLFELLKDLLTVHPNLQTLEITTAHSPAAPSKTFLMDHCALLCEGLKQTKTLKELIIYDHSEIDDKMSQMLATAINENKSLNTIRLCSQMAVRQSLLASLKKNSRIQILEISGSNKIDSDLNAQLLKDLFGDNTTINTLSLTSIHYSMEDLDPLMSFLQETSSLRTLDFPISGYRPKGEAFYSVTADRERKYLDEILPRFIQSTLTRPLASIRTLKLPFLGDEDLNMVLKALIDNSTLTNLQLGGVDVDEDPFDAEFFCFLSMNENTVEIWNELLTKNKVLKEIALNGLICPKQDLSSFSTVSVDWFKYNKTLTKLDLRANNMASALLGDALSHNKTLKAFGISHHFMPDPLWQQLLTNTTLIDIDISDFYYSFGSKDTCLFLQQNRTAQKLVSVPDQSEGDQFLEELAKNTNITSFRNILPSYSIPLEFSVQKITLLKENWILTDLELYERNWYKALYEPILIRNRLFKLNITLVMHNIARQKPPILPLEIWRLIFRHLTPDVSILM